MLYEQLINLLNDGKIKDLKAWSEEAADMGREKEKRFLAYTQRMLRENYIYNLHIPEISYLNSREEQFSTRFAPFIHERNIISLMNEQGGIGHIAKCKRKDRIF